MPPTLAKRIIHPTWTSGDLVMETAVETAGPAVASLVADTWVAPDPEQELILDALFAVRPDGRPAAFEVSVIAPRQQLKTGLILMAELGWIFLTEERLILHTAHRSFAVESAFRDLRRIITGNPSLSKRLAPTRSKGITTGNGDEAIEFRDGGRIQYSTRTADAGRSLTGNKVVGDEWFAATAEHVGAIFPTLSVVRAPQVLLASSAGKASSEVLRGVRDRGRGRLDPRQAYFEWGDPSAWEGCELGDVCDHVYGVQGCALDDETRWDAFLTALGRRMTPETVRSLRSTMPPLEYAREVFGWWDDPVKARKTVLPGWGGLDARPRMPDGSRGELDPPSDGLVLGVAVDVDLRFASIGAGSRWPDGRIHLGAVDRRPGTSWLTGRLLDLQDRLACPIVADRKSPDANLVDRLDEAGVDVEWLDLEEVLSACSWLVTAVDDREVTHAGHPELEDAVTGAVKRRVGDRFAWGRRQSVADVSMLEAVTFAGDGVHRGLTGSAFNIY